MSVEIWKGVCGGGTPGMTYDTEVYARREADTVVIKQDYDGSEVDSYVVMSESEAIDIALCILRELAPGFYQALGEKQ